ncbi:hypothetical protein [Candidatus Chlamydia sanziniae]|uniref:Uncharacterized protein n=1 Tax=Candidatus Chlamydia sanziniae TaxID=1806891 RepID=A0A1A9HY29_9CHLA|nr:hypothetical protein [Candidatus Chlamydia sanziniae]ANH78993.1 hypothetical protein Cs308_0823 [Candidatus Chlamydia sanziniae]
MFINKFTSSNDFVYQTNLTPFFFPTNLTPFFFPFEQGFVRNSNGLISFNLNRFLIIGALPILGMIVGAGRFYSVWSTKDPKDSTKMKVVYTAQAVIEMLGLGILLFLFRVVIFVICLLIAILRFTCCCCEETSQKILNALAEFCGVNERQRKREL